MFTFRELSRLWIICLLLQREKKGPVAERNGEMREVA
jgi:hypothetical protein